MSGQADRHMLCWCDHESLDVCSTDCAQIRQRTVVAETDRDQARFVTGEFARALHMILTPGEDLEQGWALGGDLLELHAAFERDAIAESSAELRAQQTQLLAALRQKGQEASGST